jgi:hypothetical protein
MTPRTVLAVAFAATLFGGVQAGAVARGGVVVDQPHPAGADRLRVRGPVALR